MIIWCILRDKQKTSITVIIIICHDHGIADALPEARIIGVIRLPNNIQMIGFYIVNK